MPAPGTEAFQKFILHLSFLLISVMSLLQAYEKAVALEPTRIHSLVQSGLLHLSLGSLQAAALALTAALEVCADYPPAVMGLGSTMLASARQSLALGCPGMSIKAAACTLVSCEGDCFLQAKSQQEQDGLYQSWSQTSNMVMSYLVTMSSNFLLILLRTFQDIVHHCQCHS